MTAGRSGNRRPELARMPPSAAASYCRGRCDMPSAACRSALPTNQLLYQLSYLGLDCRV